MPPIPRPRSSHLPQNGGNSNEKPQSTNPPLSQSRARRLQQKTTTIANNEIPESSTFLTNEEDEHESNAANNSFIARIRENDTLARYRREPSSPAHTNPNDGRVFTSNLSSIDFLSDSNTSRPGSTARQRRREQRGHTTTSPKDEEHHHLPPPPVTPPVYDRSISNDSQIDTVEQERKAKT